MHASRNAVSEGLCIYVSGSVTTTLVNFDIIRKLFLPLNDSFCCIGSSGGALLSAFLSLDTTASCERRRFLNMTTLLTETKTWEDVHTTLRTWVGQISGGAACTMKQWSSRFKPLNLVVYDYARARPIIVDSYDSSVTVAFALASSILHDTPAHPLPRDRLKHWIDAECVVPPSLLCYALIPKVAFHFTGVSVINGESNAAAEILDLQEKSLSRPLAHLTWNAKCMTSESDDLGSILHPRGWSGVLRARWSKPQSSHDCNDSKCIEFALGFIAWICVILANACIPIDQVTSSCSAGGATERTIDGC